MTINKRTSVRCIVCSWRGRRVWRSCECDGPCHHTGYGVCPKCGRRVDASFKFRDFKKWAAQDQAGIEALALDAKDRGGTPENPPTPVLGPPGAILAEAV